MRLIAKTAVIAALTAGVPAFADDVTPPVDTTDVFQNSTIGANSGSIGGFEGAFNATSGVEGGHAIFDDDPEGGAATGTKFFEFDTPGGADTITGFRIIFRSDGPGGPRRASSFTALADVDPGTPGFEASTGAIPIVYDATGVADITIPTGLLTA